jgi:hypothetical protein
MGSRSKLRHELRTRGQQIANANLQLVFLLAQVTDGAVAEKLDQE